MGTGLQNYMKNTMEKHRNDSVLEGTFIIPDPSDGSGVFTEPWDESNPTYNVPRLMAYTRAQGKKPQLSSQRKSATCSGLTKELAYGFVLTWDENGV